MTYTDKMLLLLATLMLITTPSVECRRIVDLTHTLDERAPKYPLGVFGISGEFVYFNEETIFENLTASGMWMAFRKYEFYEHLGTHIDAPLHFGNGRQSMEQIPPERLVGPGAVIDVRDKVKQNLNYAVTVQDINDYEQQFGQIPPSAIVMMNSGWAARYPNPYLIFGTDNISDASSFNYPGFSEEACHMLLNERQVSVVGVDSPSTDPAQTDDLYCHRYLQPNEVPLLEYVANLDSIPQNGTTIILGSIKMRRGTGGPTRTLAFIEEEGDRETNGLPGVSAGILSVALIGAVRLSG